MTSLLCSPRWNPPTRARLNAALTRWSESKHTAAAIFDFDNTCIFHDFGEAVFREQLRTFSFRLSPEAFVNHLPDAVGKVEALADGTVLKQIKGKLSSLYESLYDAHTQDGSNATAANELGFREFRATFAHLAVGLEKTPGIGAAFAYPWVCGFLAGMTDAEVRALAINAWNTAVVEPIGIQAVGRTPMRHGLRVNAEMLELFDCLAAANVRRFIVTASERHVVGTIAPLIGLNITSDCVFGMQLEKDESGRRRTTLAPDAFPTYRDGKRQTIDRAIVANGLSPALVAGDSETDLEMLSAYPECLRLIVHRTDEGGISELYADAETLLQGRDEHRGHFIPQARSVFLDATHP